MTKTTLLWKELQNYVAAGMETEKGEKLGYLKLLLHTSCLIQVRVLRASFRHSSNLFEVI